MDRYLVIDTQDLTVITTNSITFNDTNDGSSIQCVDTNDLIAESMASIREIKHYLQNH